jgi:hypothetical protein
MRRVIGLIAAIMTAAFVSPSHAGELARWEGWIVGEPCVRSLQIAECPLRFVNQPVLLLENGEHLNFLYGEKSSLKHSDIDIAYGRKVAIQGEQRNGVIMPARLDVLEVTGEKKFFKGCL